MKEIELPSKDETSVLVKSGEVKVEIELFDFNSIRKKCSESINADGLDFDSDLMLIRLQEAIKEKYDLDISKDAVYQLAGTFYLIEEDLKKKYSQNLESVDSTDSDQPSESEDLKKKKRSSRKKKTKE